MPTLTRPQLAAAGYQFVCWGSAGRVTGPDARPSAKVEYWGHPVTGEFVIVPHNWRERPRSAILDHWRARGFDVVRQTVRHWRERRRGRVVRPRHA